jgi:hypothetical protein
VFPALSYVCSSRCKVPSFQAIFCWALSLSVAAVRNPAPMYGR